jgi:hypothetical protein
MLIVTTKLCAGLTQPKELTATTLIVPADKPAVAVMLLVVELPLQPFGKVQV